MITKIQDVRGDQIDWVSSGSRFKKFREENNLSLLEAAQDMDLSESVITHFERGSYTDRKSTNIIWKISSRWNLSINWLLNGIGEPHDPDPVKLMPETLMIQKGAGIRRSGSRTEAEDGIYADQILEFVMAVDKFKNTHQSRFPSLTQIYEILEALGYRKSVPARIAPLGYIVEHQQAAEKIKAEDEEIPVKVGRKSEFVFTDPEGRQHIVDDLPQFCLEHDLMTRVIL